MKSILNTVDSKEQFKLLHHGQPFDEDLKNLLLSHLIKQTNNASRGQEEQFHNSGRCTNDKIEPKNGQKKPIECMGDDIDQHSFKKRRIIPLIDCIIQESMEEQRRMEFELRVSTTIVQKRTRELSLVYAKLCSAEEKITLITSQLKEVEEKTELISRENENLIRSNNIYAENAIVAREQISEQLDAINVLMNLATRTPPNVQNVVPLFTVCVDAGVRDPQQLQSFDHFAFAYRGPALNLLFLKPLKDPNISGVKSAIDIRTQTNYIAIRMSSHRCCTPQAVAGIMQKIINLNINSMILVQPLDGNVVIFKPDSPILNPIVAAIRSGKATSWDRTKQIWKL